jgi:hypothetical protein
MERRKSAKTNVKAFSVIKYSFYVPKYFMESVQIE